MTEPAVERLAEQREQSLGAGGKGPGSAGRSFPLFGWVLLLLGGLVLFGMLTRVAQRGRFTTPYSSYSTGDNGARALYLLAEAEGYAPRRVTRELADLPEAASLVVLGGCKTEAHQKLGRFEKAAVERFVKGGGTLFIVGASRFPPDGFPVAITGEEDCDAFSSFLSAEAERESVTGSSVLAGFGPLEQRVSGSVAVDEGVAHTLLLSGETGPKAVSFSFGSGTVVAFSSGALFQNENLLDQHGGVVFGRLLRHYHPGGPVLFDELHLGVGQRRSAFQYFRQKGASFIALQMLLMALLVFWRVGARIGRVREPRVPWAGGQRPFVEAMAGLYRRSRDVEGVLARLRSHALARIARFHHLEGQPAPMLASALRDRDQHVAANAVEQIQQLQRSLESQGQLFTAAQQIEKLKADATSAKFRPTAMG